MNPFTIYRKTLVFSWIKFGIGMIVLLTCLAILGAVWLLITNFTFDLSQSIIIGCVAFLLAVAVNTFVMARLGYRFQIGHLALIERAHRGDGIPDQPIEFSKTVIQNRFGNIRKFYANSRNIRITITQLTRVLRKGFSLNTDIPNLDLSYRLKAGMSMPALRYMDECCLSLSLRRSNDELNVTIVDALTLYVQENTDIIRKGFRLSLCHIGMCLLAFAIFFVPGFFVCQSYGLNYLPWLVASFFIMLTIKGAFLDSYVLTKTVCDFLTMVKNVTINPDYYEKLDHWSKSYEKIRSSIIMNGNSTKSNLPKNTEETSQTEKNPEDSSQTETNSEETSQTETHSEETSQTETNSEETSQTETNSEETSQTETHSEETSQTKKNSKDSSQTETNSEDSSQTETNPEENP